MNRERIIIRDGQAVTVPLPVRQDDRPDDRTERFHVERPDPQVRDTAGRPIGNYI